MGPTAARSAAVHVDAASADFAATVVSLPPSGADPRSSAPDSGIDSALLSGDEGGAASAPASGEPALGHIGRYELQRTLGRGGLGAVYEAHDPLLSRTVAVKTLHFAAAPGARVALDRLFLNEARAAAGLSHPHIVTVFDAGLSAHGVYIAMERLRGQDLRQALTAGWRPRPAQAVLLARRVADALAYAHARGVVHCDIKPANIFLGRSGKPKLLDFGIARIVRRAPGAPGTAGADGAAGAAGAAPALLDGMVAGSPHYLAPEQLRGDAVDGRTDVYALGVVLYELLAGRKAFVGDSIEQIHAAVLSHVPPPADEVDPALPAGLARLVAQAMARDPAERPAGAADFARALRPWHAELDADGADRGALAPKVSAPITVPDTVPDTASASGPAPATDAPSRDLRMRPMAWSAAALLALAGVFALTGGGGVDGDTLAGATAAPDAAALASAAPGTAAGAAAADTGPAAAAATGLAAAAAMDTGLVHLAIHPRGEVEVDGNPAGLAAPTATLELSAGPHLIIVRREGQPAFITEVDVRPGEPVSIAHRFGR